jgi:HD-like signal output (HDOD) protein
MPEQAVIERVQSAVRIPTLPRIVDRLMQLLLQPDAGFREISAEVAKDPQLAAQVIRVANGAYYGLEEPVMDLDRAAVILGMRTLHEIVLRVCVMREFEEVEERGLSIEGLWRHSILTGQLCQTLGSRCTAKIALGPGDLYTCGLLHDLGRLVLLDTFGGRYADVLNQARTAKVDSAPLEAETFGFNHTQVGAVLAYTWRLPTPLQAAIEGHHGPNRLLNADPVVALVALCDVVARGVEEGRRPTAAGLSDHPASRLAGISAAASEELIEQAWRDYLQIEL